MWERGEYSLSLKDEHRLGDRLIERGGAAIVIIAILICLGWVAHAFGRLLLGAGEPGYEYNLVVAVALLAGTAACLVPGLALFARGFVLLGKFNIVEANLGNQGIQARLTDERQVTYAWSQLKRILQSSFGMMRLQFEDGMVLQLRRNSPHVHSLIKFVEETTLPNALTIRRRQERGMMVRCAGYCVVGEGFLCWAIGQLGAATPESYLIALVGFAAFSLMIVGPLFLPRLAQRLWHHLRRRRAMSRRPVLAPG